ncbi:type II toxin-antitoxin system RelE family toxin [Microbacterium sp.]|uniref:type II toxin-antitoxin system RelE family toxin n=1 Tax=Microbacterium sp. TaxID=51671 RepID=UPI003C766A78
MRASPDERIRSRPVIRVRQAHPQAGLWRLRVGDYRVIISVQNAELTVIAIDVDRRSSIYG